MLTTTVAGRTWSFSHAIGRNAIAGNAFTQPIAVALAADGVRRRLELRPNALVHLRTQPIDDILRLAPLLGELELSNRRKTIAMG